MDRCFFGLARLIGITERPFRLVECGDWTTCGGGLAFLTRGSASSICISVGVFTEAEV